MSRAFHSAAPFHSMHRKWWLSILYCAILDAASVAQGRQKVRVISDIHAGSCWQGNQTQLFDFLNQTAHDDIDMFVLNGDVYDFWLVPLDVAPPSFKESVDVGLDPKLGFDMVRFRMLLNAAAKSVVTLHEDNGNHDMWLGEDLAKKAVGDADVKWTNDTVNQWGVRFEHGHMHSLFNQVPPGTNKMPIGYFVTRVVAKFACQSQDSVSAMLTRVIAGVLGTSVIDDIAVELLRHTTFFKDLLWKILEAAAGASSKLLGNMSLPIMGVVSADQIPKGGDTCANYTLADFIDDYADTLHRFVDKVGRAESAKWISADVVPGALDLNVGQSSVAESVIVLGHTHVPQLQVVKRDNPYLSKTPDVLVANAGAWVADLTGKSQHSYVDIVIDDIDEDFSECYNTANGTDYHGQVHNTAKGEPCIPWGHDERGHAYWEKFGSVAFCRNLGDTATPWCYTGLVPGHWGKCNVGQPAATQCPREKVRGAIEVTLWSFPDATPVSEATRKPSTGSRWTVKNNVEGALSDEVQIVV